MMGSIRRKFTKAESKDPWGTDSELESEGAEVEVAADSSVLLSTKAAPSTSPSNDVDMKGFYKALITTAIQHGGKYQGMEISIPWLRMTLAGLEMRPIPPEMMWEGIHVGIFADLPEYDKLFPSEKAADSP
jgi:hypothetical protein